jgi:hypothetical protein
MFSVITNIYTKKTKGPTLMELFTATGKLKKFFLQLEMFDVCTTGDTAHIDTIFKFLPHTRQHGCIDIFYCCNDPCIAAVKNIDAPMLMRVCGKKLNIVSMCAVSPVVHTSNISSCQKNISFPVVVNNSIKVGPLVFLLYMFVITENIIKRPV